MWSGAHTSAADESSSRNAVQSPVKPAPWRKRSGAPAPLRRSATGVPATSIISACTELCATDVMLPPPPRAVPLRPHGRRSSVLERVPAAGIDEAFRLPRAQATGCIVHDRRGVLQHLLEDLPRPLDLVLADEQGVVADHRIVEQPLVGLGRAG